MMRSPHAWGIAVRKPSGELATHCKALQRPSEKHKWLGWPFVRGLATLGQAMRLGFVASKFSLDVNMEDVKISPWAMTLSMVASIGFFIVMYKLAPAGATLGLSRFWPALKGNVAFNL